MAKIRKYFATTLTTSLLVLPLISCSGGEEKEHKKDIKTLISEEVQLLQKNIKQINLLHYDLAIADLKTKEFNSTKFITLKKNVIQQLQQIKEANDLLEVHLPNLKVKFNLKYFHKFKTDFENENKLIIKPLQEVIIKSVDNFTLSKDIDAKIKSEIFKLQTHTLTITNFLKGAYNSLLNKNQFNPLDDWQKAHLDKDVFNYYKPILNKKGNELVTGLQMLLEKSTKENESPKSYADIWDLFKKPGFKDLERGKEDKILDIYSKNSLGHDVFNYDENNANHGNHNDKHIGRLGHSYNREHLIAQSFFKGEAPMKHDGHHMLPTDSWTNAVRGNSDHGIVVKENERHRKDSVSHFANDSKIGLDKDGETVFEPTDAFKGDVARAYLYFSIRYSKRISEFKDGFAFIDGFPFLKEKRLNTFLDWHENVDLVNMYDLNRNQEVYNFQHNRNPFIDIPYLSKWIWNKNYQNVPLTFIEK